MCVRVYIYIIWLNRILLKTEHISLKIVGTGQFIREQSSSNFYTRCTVMNIDIYVVINGSEFHYYHDNTIMRSTCTNRPYGTNQQCQTINKNDITFCFGEHK